jgi:tetratricopeptide (TPR) repeat protein
LEARLGEYGKATETLKKAVSLNSGDSSARAKAYVLLAENAFNTGDIESAKAYATVVTALYTDTNLLLRAERIIKAGEKK